MKLLAVAGILLCVAVALRWWLLDTFGSRARDQKLRRRVEAERPRTEAQRLAAALALPVFLVLVAAVAVIGVIVGAWVGPH